MAPFSGLFISLAERRGQLFVWCPVCFATGIGIYFSLSEEPSIWLLCGLALVALIAVAVAYVKTTVLTPILVVVVLIIAGGVTAAIQTHGVSAPVLGFRYYGPIEGRILKIDKSQSDAIRLTLDQVVLSDMSPDKVPKRVRVALHGTLGYVDPVPGLRVMLTGHLSPPSGPVEPGGFDFQRHAWFLKIGAVGYTRTPVLRRAPAERSVWLALHRLRQSILRGVTHRVQGDRGAFAAALLTGDRSQISPAGLEALRHANLAHLLAISGLHMGLLTGLVLGALRLCFALWPWFALRAPTKKRAAGGALAAAGFYLALSGGNVATQRAFVMVSVMLLAILLDRRALTLRAVAIAAMILLILRPEALSEPGFQMSFAATTALVAVWQACQKIDTRSVPKPLKWFGALALSSLIAGAATAPFSAAHFNQIAHYGLLANMLALPVMSIIVMPAAILTTLLWPFGLAGWGLWMMAFGCQWILAVAHWVSGMEGAIRQIPAPPELVLPFISFGALTVILWQGRMRWAGLLFCGVGLCLWQSHARPDVLIAGSGRTVGVLRQQERVMNKPRGDGFVVKNWLENDGDGAAQSLAAARDGFESRDKDRIWLGKPLKIAVLAGRDPTARVAQYCNKGFWVVLPAKRTGDYPADCEVFDPQRLSETGVIAIRLQDGFPQMETARERAGVRPWNSP